MRGIAIMIFFGKNLSSKTTNHFVCIVRQKHSGLVAILKMTDRILTELHNIRYKYHNEVFGIKMHIIQCDRLYFCTSNNIRITIN